MARIRSIHPGFFTDEAIVSASPQAQVFLIGLWTQCDDQGVFEWKPVTLKMRILPAANCDATVLLAELAALGIIKQIDVGPLKYGLVRNFRKYQRPKKPNSAYPLPAEFRTYVGLTGKIPEPDDGEEADSGPPDTPEGGPDSPPVPHQGGTGSEIRPQMEEEGGRMKGKEVGVPLAVTESGAAGAPAPTDDLEIPPFLRAESRSRPIADDWQPSDTARANLRSSRPDLDDATLERRMVEFRAWCAETNKHTFNPDATWLSFMVKTHVKPSPRQSPADAFDANLAALAEFGRTGTG